MCGITGIRIFSEEARSQLRHVEAATSMLEKRGPDDEGVFTDGFTALGHRRLSIIDTSKAGRQPFSDPTGRYTIVFNGEFFNFAAYRKELLSKGVQFISSTDTEVLLHLWMRKKEKCLEKIIGFFAFAVYDRDEQSLHIVRDRYGVKPLLYTIDKNRIAFASEMKALLCYEPARQIDPVSLNIYLELNYIPAPHSIFKSVKKLEPGHYLVVKNGQCERKRYYETAPENKEEVPGYELAKTTVRKLLEEAVERRLVSDVPLGSFLSGGIDSSVVTAIAARLSPGLRTFSIGFPDEPHFDETRFAELLARKYKTSHTVFALKNEELFASLHEALGYLDEPFADSSALLVYILSRETRRSVTVALTGDGADELFTGYNKHAAEYRVRNKNLVSGMVRAGGPLWKILPQSRNSKPANLFRQLHKFSEGMSLGNRDRYWKWAGFADHGETSDMLIEPGDEKNYLERKNELTAGIDDNFNSLLRADFNLVLQNDMLVKTDLMSMANGLELRSPFLDNKLVDYVFSLPGSYKIDSNSRKKILKDSCRDLLPPEIFGRAKQGFEVPLLNWLKTDLKSLIFDDLLSEAFISEQGIFNITVINRLKQKLMSPAPADAVARIWGLLVFQVWWKKYAVKEGSIPVK